MLQVPRTRHFLRTRKLSQMKRIRKISLTSQQLQATYRRVSHQSQYDGKCGVPNKCFSQLRSEPAVNHCDKQHPGSRPSYFLPTRSGKLTDSVWQMWTQSKQYQFLPSHLESMRIPGRFFWSHSREYFPGTRDFKCSSSANKHFLN